MGGNMSQMDPNAMYQMMGGSFNPYSDPNFIMQMQQQMVNMPFGN